ncbi:hypothetical protein E1B28_006438 [Marasmius oreades]|uniref:Uncharacterized protein n=1 Tax=Marasmius oreades TaxID=181124 RepID=A0A9P7S617_9AGAR|nr:uncharacterized protein E1B28_006438 [Marasmius oreades]KAG7095725.1 hypothetical protein E1B28_006438 [Marasmius oreades]
MPVLTPQSTVTAHRTSFERSHIVPVAEFFRRYVFCEEKGFSSSDFGYKKSTWPYGTGELFTFYYHPLEPAAETKPLASVLVLPRGQVCWNDFQRLFRNESDKWFKCRKNLPLLEHLDEFWHSEARPPYLALTDEFNVEIIHEYSHVFYPTFSLLSISGWSAPLSDKLTLRCAIGATLDKATPGKYRYYSGIPFHPVQGALNHIDPSLPASPIATNQCPTCFLDFDLFTMQRHPPDFDSFFDWKESIEDEVLSQPLRVGDELTICLDGFIKRSPLLPFFLPLEKPSTSTLEAIMKRPRSRHVDVDHILTQTRNSGTLHLFVTKVVRYGLNKFSQVVFGRLRWTSVDGKETSETENTVCLKMFDEALFPVPGYEAFEDDRDIFSNTIHPNERLLDLNFGDDMMRREYAVYNRLEYLQGTLLPHAYGFHEVTLPTGRMVNGFLMEIAIGHSLGSLPLETWPESAQTQLVRRLRHGLSALRYGGVDQGDWHLDQIILRPLWPAEAPEDVFDLDIVFIDFAFTYLRQGIARGLRVAETFSLGDHLKLSLLLSEAIPRSVVNDNWPDYDDFER